MDPLKIHIFEALRNQSCGDAKIDDTNLNTSRYIRGILKKYTEATDRIEANKNHFTEEGKAIHRQKAAKESLKELREIQERSNWKPDIEKVERKFDDPGETESDIKILIRESREREVRSRMHEVEGDPVSFEMVFGERIRSGDPVITGAVVHSPLTLQIAPELEKVAIEQYRLSKNPFAASRLKTLTKAQQIHTDLFRFAEEELGISQGADSIAELAGGG